MMENAGTSNSFQCRLSSPLSFRLPRRAVGLGFVTWDQDPRSPDGMWGRRTTNQNASTIELEV